MPETTPFHPLISCNIHFLRQGAGILQDVTDRQYVFNDSPFYDSGVGDHMRHILDHYSSFFNGLEGKVDYDARLRGTEIEKSREAAISLCHELAEKLIEMGEEGIAMDYEVAVKSNEGTEEVNNPFSRSSVMRELQFLISHTVHHYALIAFILRTQGVPVPDTFGVAPSTLRYQQKQFHKRTE